MPILSSWALTDPTFRRLGQAMLDPMVSAGPIERAAEGVLGGPVNGDEDVRLAVLGADLGDVDVELAGRVALGGPLGCLVAPDAGRPADAALPGAAV